MFVRTSKTRIVNLTSASYVGILSKHRDSKYEAEINAYYPAEGSYGVRIFQGSMKECERVIEQLHFAIKLGARAFDLSNQTGTKRSEMDEKARL